MTRLVPALLAAVLVAVLAAPARAQDSMAPPGADPSWLPDVQWVNLRWLPWDEDRLYRTLKTDRGEVFRWVRIDAHNSLWRLARRQGYRGSLDRLARTLAPRGRRATSRAELVRRARRTLHQPHLAQHLLFHDLHQTAVADRSRRIFGVGRRTFFDLRRAELSPLQIGELSGRSRAELAQGVVTTLRDANALGVRQGAMSRGQARTLLARQLSQVPRWLAQSRYNGPTAGARRPDLPAGDYANRPSITADGTQVTWDAYRTDRFQAERMGEIHVAGLHLAAAHRFGVSPPERPGSKRPTSAYNSSVAAGGGAAVFETAETSYPLAKRVGQMTVVHRDLRTGKLTKVSEVGRPEGVRTRTAFNPSVSADGAFVVFEASDVGHDGAPLGNGVWLADVAAGTQRRLVAERPGAAYGPVISADATKVAWTAPAGRHTQVVVRDVASGAEQVVRAAGDVYEPSLSADGGIVAFTTRARDLGGSGGGASRVYVRRLATGATRLASSGVRFAHQPALSGDGTRVAFVARRRTRQATILAQRSTVLVRDVVAGGLRRTAFGRRGWSTQPVLDRTGTTLALTTTARVAAKPFGLAGVVLLDLTTGTAPRLLSTHRRSSSPPAPSSGSREPEHMH